MIRKKLIEVALPLEAINEASAREKSIRHGHPSTLHLWWARRPLAAARAVIFAQMVDDPGSWPELFPTEKKQQKERERLFRIIEDLVKWENTNNENVLNAAREEIWQSWRRACAENADHPQAKELFDRNTLPAFHDPFAGGGALPLEAQRLGLESYASDLNPVAVLINKAMIEIPPKFAGQKPVHALNTANDSIELAPNHIFQNRWDSGGMGGPGTVDVWKVSENEYYTTFDSGDFSEDPQQLRDTEEAVGPYKTLKSLFKAQGATLFAIGPATKSVASQAHSIKDLRKLLFVEPTLMDEDSVTKDWHLQINGVNHQVNTSKGVIPNKEDKSQQIAIGLEHTWKGAQGLAEDVRHYGQWMRDEAEKRIGHLYPKVKVTSEMVKERPDLKPYQDEELTVIAWIWARTVKSPNPAFADVDVPLASTFILSSKSGKEAYVEPLIDKNGYKFLVKTGKPIDNEKAERGTKISRGSFECLMSSAPISYSYIDDEANSCKMDKRLMAIVAEGKRGRVYLPPIKMHEETAISADPIWKPETPSRGTWGSNAQGRIYGFKTFGDYFTSRQLVALNTFSDLVGEAITRIEMDAIKAGLPNDGKALNDGGTGAKAYAEAVGVYLAFAIDKSSVYWNSLCPWLNQPKNEIVGNSFGRQAVPMVWDYAEANPFSSSGGNIEKQIDSIIKVLSFCLESIIQGSANQEDASRQSISKSKVISTDPPYYDNIGYADLSDFFYVWLRRNLKTAYPNLFATLAVPKAEELVATSYRHGSKDAAEIFFLNGMTSAMHRLSELAHPNYPLTIYYAFKQSESNELEGTTNTGWDTFLAAVIESGLSIDGTWPMRTEREGRMIGNGTNALASSIVLVCRKRSAQLSSTSRRDFINALKAELPSALKNLQAGNIAPVDLAQASIGPGMAIYTRYSEVLDAEGKALSVREAMALINQVLDETLAEQEGDFDSDTRFALTWFEQQGYEEGEFGVADVLARAKGTSVQGMVDAGVLHSGRGKVRLLKAAELPANWNPEKDDRLTVWECVHHLIKQLEAGGETAAADLVNQLASKADTARELAYRLYSICERKKRAQDAMAYNALVQSWPEIQRIAQEPRRTETVQTDLFNEQ